MVSVFFSESWKLYSPKVFWSTSLPDGIGALWGDVVNISFMKTCSLTSYLKVLSMVHPVWTRAGRPRCVCPNWPVVAPLYSLINSRTDYIKKMYWSYHYKTLKVFKTVPLRFDTMSKTWLSIIKRLLEVICRNAAESLCYSGLDDF